MKDNDIIEGESFNSSESKKKMFGNRNILIGLLVVVVLFLGVVSTRTLLQQQTQQGVDAADGNLNSCGQIGGFCETFDGAPATPVPLGGIAGKAIFPNWQFAVHSRDNNTWETLETQNNVMHGHDCSAPPATHTNNTYEGAAFNCKNHVMTAMTAGGYGLVAMTPNAMVDFSNGTAIVQWEMSTNRQSTRDWPDVWITPWDDASILPYDAGDVDMQGPPKNGVKISAAANQNSWGGVIYQNGNATDIESAWWVSMNEGIADNTNQDATRQTFRITISNNHIKMERLPSATAPEGIVWIDQDIPSLNFNKGVAQFAHHIYNPEKDGAGVPATWHWDAIALNPAIPFTIIHADKRTITWPNTGSVTFDSPAPANSLLKFAAMGNVEISFNNGSTWTVIPKQIAMDGGGAGHWAPFSTPIPQGTQNVQFRLSNDGWWQCGTWGCMAEDFAIWSQTAPAGGTSPTPTPIPGQPTNTPAPTNTPIPTPTRTPTPTPTRIPTPTPTRTPTPSITLAPTIPPTSTSWVGQYYQFGRNSTTKGLNGTPVMTRSDNQINFTWGYGSPAKRIKSDRFSVRWTSQPYMSAGTYEFMTISDDGVRVYFDGQLLSGVSLWSDHGTTTLTQNVQVAEGVHTIVVEYYENGGYSRIQFSATKL